MEKKVFKLTVVKELYDQALSKSEVRRKLKEEYNLNPRELEAVMELSDAKGWKPEKHAMTIDIIDDSDEQFEEYGDELPAEAPESTGIMSQSNSREGHLPINSLDSEVNN